MPIADIYQGTAYPDMGTYVHGMGHSMRWLVLKDKTAIPIDEPVIRAIPDFDTSGVSFQQTLEVSYEFAECVRSLKKAQRDASDALSEIQGLRSSA